MPLNDLQIERMQLVADEIERRKEYFDMSQYDGGSNKLRHFKSFPVIETGKDVHVHCGTIGCIAGYADIMNRMYFPDPGKYDVFSVPHSGRDYLRLSLANSMNLFVGFHCNSVWKRYIDHKLFENCRWEMDSYEVHLSSITPTAAVKMLRALADGTLTLTPDSKIHYVLTKEQKDILQKIYNAINENPAGFDMTSYDAKECGTVGCIAGYMARLHPQWERQESVPLLAAEVFGQDRWWLTHQLFWSEKEAIWYRYFEARSLEEVTASMALQGLRGLIQENFFLLN